MLREQINSDLKNALKRGEELKLRTLRLLVSAIHNREIEERGKKGKEGLEDGEVLEVLMREAKKRKEAAEIYEKGGRTDLAEQEKNELNIISAYLPQEMNLEELEKIVNKAISDLDAAHQKDFGRVMSEVMKQVRGRAEGARVAEIIKSKLGH